MAKDTVRQFVFQEFIFRGEWAMCEEWDSDKETPTWILTGVRSHLVSVPLSILDEVFLFFLPDSKEDVSAELYPVSPSELRLRVRVSSPTRNIPRPQSVSNEFYFAHREMPTDDWQSPYCPAALLGDGTIISIQAGKSKYGGGHYSQPQDNETDFYNLFSVSLMPNAKGFNGDDGAYTPQVLLDKYIEDHGGIIGTARFSYGADEPEITLF